MGKADYDTIVGPSASAGVKPRSDPALGWLQNELHFQKWGLTPAHAIHSDLHGVSQIRFADNVEHSYLEIEKDLQAAKLA